MRHLILPLLIAVFVSGLIGAALAANTTNVDTKVKTLAAFKNGLGFVFRSGDAKLVDGWATMQELPPAALGTLWIGTTSLEAPVEEVISYKGTVFEEVDALDLSGLLDANVGKSVEIVYSGGGTEASFVKGVLLSSGGRQPVSSPAPDPRFYNSSIRPPEPSRSQIVLVKSIDGSIVAFEKSAIRSVKLPGDASVKTKIERPANGAKIKVRGKPASAKVTLAYLEKGITWSPSYLVNLLSEKEAELTLDSVLANDVEDLEDVDVSFVVGYPNFAFSDVITPLNLQQSVATFVQAITRGPRDAYPSASIASQSIAYNTAVYDSTDARWRPEMAYSTTQMSGESNEDLYFYRQPHVTLKKGDRARYTVTSAKIPIEHIYLWEVSDMMNVDDRGYRRDSDRDQRPEDQVWHALRMKNTTTQPWTTAPAFAVKGSMPVAQDTLRYTPPKGESTLKLTVAVDVRADQSENEVSRKAVPDPYSSYDEVLVDGTLLIKNMKSSSVKMKVNKLLTGEVLQSEGGKVTKVTKRLSAVNPKSDIAWEFSLEPGAEKRLDYKYKVLLRR